MNMPLTRSEIAPDTAIKIGLETCGYDRFFEEITRTGMIGAHWAEVGTHRDVLTLDPDHDRYRLLEKAGALLILSARDQGELVGYLFLLLLKHPRDKSKTVMKDDAVYVRPAYRRKHVGWHMMNRAHDMAPEIGCDLIFFTEKARRHLLRGKRGGYLERLGFEPVEIIYAKVCK